MPALLDSWPALVLLGLILALPWLVTWIKKTGWQGVKHAEQSLKLVSAVAVGPQQKVVTVEVGLGNHRKWLVLGVTPQSIACLDSWSDKHLSQESPVGPPAPTFQEALQAHRPPTP